MKHSATRIAVLLLLLPILLSVLPSLSASALSGEDAIARNTGELSSLPFSATGSFTVAAGNNTADSSDEYSFRAEGGNILSLFLSLTAKRSSSASAVEDPPPVYTSVALTVFSDSGEKLLQKESEGDTTDALFLPVYTGAYHIRLSFRAHTSGTWNYRLSLCQGKIKGQTLSNLPYEGTRPGALSRTSLSELFPNGAGAGFASGTSLVLYSFPCEAASILSYRLTSEGKAPNIRAFLFLPAGDRTAVREGQTGNGYLCGDAAEVSYQGTCHLLVASDSGYRLSLSCLSHEPFCVTDLTLPYEGTLSVSATELYDRDSLNELLKEFPFSGIEPRKACFFRLPETGSAVLTLCCRPQTAADIGFVSDAKGLSDRSFYPLQPLSEYSSALSPTPYVYQSVIAAECAGYLCYRGSADSVEISLAASPTHSSEPLPDTVYHAGDELPVPAITSVYNDRMTAEIPDIPTTQTTLCRVGGYLICSDGGERRYYPKNGVPSVPDEGGNYTLYAVLLCDYGFSDGNTDSQSFRVPIGHFTVERKFHLFPSLSPQSDPLPLLIGLSLVPVVAIAATLVALKWRRGKKENQNRQNTEGKS